MSTESISNQSIKNIPQQTTTAQSAVATSRQEAVEESGNNIPQDSQSGQNVSKQELQGAVEKLNDHMQNIQRDLNFSIDDSSGKTVVRVVDSTTDELVRQIPSETVLRISENIQEQLDSADGLILSDFA